MPEPIRKSILPTTPPPEWEFATVLGAPHGCALLPTDTGDVVVRRRVTYGDWEPVRPDHWADEPATVGGAARTASGQQPETTPCGHCKGSGADPEDEGDYVPEVHRHNPFSVGPCPECNGDGTTVGQPAEETHVVTDDSDDPEHIDDCPGCEVGIEHTEHCPSPEAHNWGCGCPTDERPDPAVGQPAEAQATDRAAVFDEAADEVERENAGCLVTIVGRPCQPCATRAAVATHLRRMAEEARS